ncbi:desmethyl-deoxy-podophyllotoxin synthase-like [Mercurialis annua]|uniref:desmethyl-deoxy-podophyllotoxin synthase-like n=1 Tax=Mercurialis annua TaxID=3986 RepID=UPI00215F0E02|nr:desmethyl-deoxy-podophyllotoxin synthase-like [Mercurialis annua]
MDLQFSLFSLFLSFLFILMVMSLLKIIKTSRITKNLPPGPLKIPIIGNIHNLLGSLPHRRLHALAQEFGPIMHLQLGEVTTIIVSSPKIAKEILKTHDSIFSSRSFNVAGRIISYNSSDIAFAPYGESWRQMRKVCTIEVLSAKRVQSFRPIREDEIMNVMRSISCSVAEGSEVNLSKLLFGYAYKVISRAAFGKMRKEEEAFIPYVKGTIEVISSFSVANLFPSIKFLHHIGGMRARIERLHQESDKILESIINDHKLKRKGLRKNINDYEEGDDLVDVLLNIQEKEDLDFTLTTENIKGVILDMFVGGSETSSTTAEWALSEMMRNPRVMRKAQEEARKVFGEKKYIDEADFGELKYLKLVIKETLRLHPPSPLALSRESQGECEIDGFCIPNKSKVVINAWAIGRDPSYWSEAESFIPERFLDCKIEYKGTNFEFLPFGGGRRICPGMAFGIANVELPLANLLYYFNWKLPDKMKANELDMAEAVGPSVRRKNDLSLIPTVYHPLPGML